MENSTLRPETCAADGQLMQVCESCGDGNGVPVGDLDAGNAVI